MDDTQRCLLCKVGTSYFVKAQGKRRESACTYSYVNWAKRARSQRTANRGPLSGNAEGRHGTVIGRRQFALGRPRGLESAAREDEVRLSRAAVSIHILSLLAVPLPLACTVIRRRRRARRDRARNDATLCLLATWRDLPWGGSAWRSLRSQPGQARVVVCMGCNKC
ncbi:hypothetical protein J3F83DRAFT_414696 [Trichoderma novae-zelandiae]